MQLADHRGNKRSVYPQSNQQYVISLRSDRALFLIQTAQGQPSHLSSRGFSSDESSIHDPANALPWMNVVIAVRIFHRIEADRSMNNALSLSPTLFSSAALHHHLHCARVHNRAAQCARATSRIYAQRLLIDRK